MFYKGWQLLFRIFAKKSKYRRVEVDVVTTICSSPNSSERAFVTHTFLLLSFFFSSLGFLFAAIAIFVRPSSLQSNL
jgi:hypothetical protein